MNKEEKMAKEEQQRLEDEAYHELCQIIEYAMMIENIEYLEMMVAAWKNRYKKILANPSPTFKKRIDYLLNQFYSEVIRSILSQIRFKEEKAIKNQRKALNQLYSLIRDINDLPTLKKEIKKWESKYPYDSFLRMYKVRIDLAKRDKNLRENAFNQDEAFRDLYYGVVNRNGTIDELKDYLKDWEKKYRINDKFKIDDFLRHQSEIKRYVSDDYLKSIAKVLPQEQEPKTAPKVETSPSSKIQNKAYLKLLHITKNSKDISKMFKWVYENSHIHFNKEYRGLILAATNLDYPIKYLKRFKPPKINLNTSTLSYDEYANIDKIKEYSIVSYFNLLAGGNSISNAYFNKCVATVYNKAQKKVDHTVKEEEVQELLKETSVNSEISTSTSTELVLDSNELDNSDAIVVNIEHHDKEAELPPIAEKHDVPRAQEIKGPDVIASTVQENVQENAQEDVKVQEQEPVTYENQGQDNVTISIKKPDNSEAVVLDIENVKNEEGSNNNKTTDSDLENTSITENESLSIEKQDTSYEIDKNKPEQDSHESITISVKEVDDTDNTTTTLQVEKDDTSDSIIISEEELDTPDSITISVKKPDDDSGKTSKTPLQMEKDDSSDNITISKEEKDHSDMITISVKEEAKSFNNTTLSTEEPELDVIAVTDSNPVSLLLEVINYKSEQAEKQEEFNEELDEYLEHPEQEISLFDMQKQKND